MPDVYLTKIIENAPLAANVYSVTAACKELAAEAYAGQFLHINCGHSRLLRRPISICAVSGDIVRFVFEVKGKGTRWLAERAAGKIINILGPLGKGYTIPDGKIIVVGGGVGTPPLLYAAQTAKNDVTAILGFRDKSNIILTDDFKAVCHNVIITTDNGSSGIPGDVTGPLKELLTKEKYAAVLSCGPYNMQKAVASLCKRYDTPCQVSLEERMACGVGACLVCACSVKVDGIDDMSRVCADGPVYDATEINW